METYCGHVRTPADAIKLFEACRLGLLPRVQRRLSEKERQSIKSGSVFVWDEREAGMRRWTDGKSWSASRVSGSFLTYREMEGKRGGGNFVPAPVRQRVAGKTPDSGRGSDEDAEMDGEGPDGYRYKPDGLMKQSFSITTSSGQHLHLISYYARPHATSQELLQPTTDPALRHILPVKGMYPESTVSEQTQGPAVTRAPMPTAYISPSHQTAQGPPPQAPLRGPYPYTVPQGYAWPPSPVSTPPYTYVVAGYGPQLQPPIQAPPYDRGAPYERPPIQEHSYQPGLPHSHHPYAVNGPPQVTPGYGPNVSPRTQAGLIAEQQARQAHQAAQDQQQPMAQSSMIDPRITALSPPNKQTNGHMISAPQGPPTSAPSREDSGERHHSTSSSQLTNGSSGHSQTPSSNIPSISSIVHNHTPATTADDARSTGNASTGATSRAGSASPKDGSMKNKAPQEIPQTRLGIGGEDVRALRVLDRKFCI